MSLDWDLRNIADSGTVCWSEGKMNVVTECLIWSTLIVGMGEITNENWKEFLIRLRIYDNLFGSFLYRKGEASKVTVQEMISHIGLKTNVPYERPGPWARKLLERKIRNITQAVEGEIGKGGPS